MMASASPASGVRWYFSMISLLRLMAAT